MKHILPVVLLSVFFGTIFTIIHSFKPPSSAFSRALERETTVHVSIGEPILSLYGYTSPEAKVLLAGYPSVFSETKAQRNGYFRFTGVFLLPFVKELCLNAIDREDRITNPICIPAPSMTFKGNIIGPVILPPSVSVGKGTFLPGETVEASGESIPESEISVSLFKAEPTLNLFGHLIREVYATTLPSYTIKTDQNGYFSFNLPSTTSNKFRFFSQVKFENSPSPKSNTLTVKILSIFEYLLEKIKFLLLLAYNLLKNLPLLGTFIILEIVLLLILLFHSKKRSLMVVKKEVEVYGKGRELQISNF